MGGPTWPVPLGRRDARTANQSAANTDLPPPFANLTTLIAMFAEKNLSAVDMVALSGAHTVGLAQCFTFRQRIYKEANINPYFAANRRGACPFTGGDTNLAVLDTQTPNRFDNKYYENLVSRHGLLHSDQALFSNESQDSVGSQDSLVRFYSTNLAAFMHDFGAAMVKMGNLSPLTGTAGEIRRNCRVIN